MHRKDYKVIANAIREMKRSPDTICNSCVEKATAIIFGVLKAENSSLNETKFRDYIEKGGY